MSQYFVPSVQIYQEFTQLPVFTESPLSVLVVGLQNDTTSNLLTVVITPPGGDTPSTVATAVATVQQGVITSIKVTAGGAGYTGNSTVSVTSSGGGSGFTGTTTRVSGAITAITVTNGGTGYPNTPVTTATTAIGSCTSDVDVENQLGPIVPTNPLALGVHFALQNSSGAAVYYAAVASEDLTGFGTALQLAQKSNAYYAIVPVYSTTLISADTTGATRGGINQAMISHVNAMSSPQQAKWRVTWLNTPLPSGITTPVVPGTASASATTNYIAALPTSGDVEGASDNSGPRRVHNVFPYQFSVGSTTYDGCFLAAALAGLRSGSVPHQSLTNTQILLDNGTVPIVTQQFAETDLDNMAAAGVWIATQDSTGGAVYTRHQLTGDATNLNYREDSVTANVDNISYALQAALAPFKGIYNISPAAVLKIRAAVDTELSYLASNTYTERAGNQLISYTIVNIAQDATFKDQVNVTIQLQVPYPMNYVVVKLSI